MEAERSSAGRQNPLAGTPAVRPILRFTSDSGLSLAGAVPGAPTRFFGARSSAAGKNFRNNLPNPSLQL